MSQPKKAGMMLMLPAPNVCQECAEKHDPEWPHNKASLYYQYSFYAKHGRWPTWADAMAHCSEDIKQAWTKELRAHGIEVPD